MTAEYNTRRRLQSVEQKKVFLRWCREEKVVPKAVSNAFRNSNVPYTNSSDLYLKEQIDICTYEARALRASLPGVHLAHHLVLSLRAELETQVLTHRRKLQ